MRPDVDVLFVNPGNRFQIYQDLGDEFCALEPPALAGLYATYVRRHGYGVAILDAPVGNLDSMDAAREAVTTYRPRLVAITVYGFQPSASTQNMTSAGEIARFVRQLDPGVKILMMGTHPAALPERTLREETVDFVCDREGPDTIVALLALLRDGADPAKAPNLWYRDAEGAVAFSHRGELLADLDGEAPGVAWDLLPMARYRAHNWHAFPDVGARAPYASIHTSLGCPYRCTFCCINAPFGKPSYRLWRPETVAAEIDTLVERYGVRHVKFCDEMFVLNRDHVLGICDRLIERGHDLNIWAYARVDTVRDEFLDKLKRAGFNWLCLGIESASQHVRDGALKKYGTDEIVDVVRRIQGAGINVIGNYIFGLPDDTPASMQQTLDMAVELNCEFANFYCAMAYPGSRLYALAVERGYALPPRWHDYSQHGYDMLPLPTDHCAAREVVAFRDAAFTTYFTGRRYLDMVTRRFGRPVAEHVNRMTAIRLRRRILDAA